MQTFEFTEGSTPLLISMPHCGTRLPDDMAATLTPAGLEVGDTDWHVEKLYDFAAGLGASVIQPHYSRYVIDLNRAPDDSNLYPGANSTGLCPTSSFADQPLYKEGCAPDADEIARRLATWWRPYHEKVQAELARLKQQHGIALLFDAHSIRSVVPRFFEGLLPDLNIGTAGGSSCAASMLSAVETLLAEQQDYSYVIDQRFKGGYITRAYGQPDSGMHSLQLELSQRNYMEEPLPFTYLPEQAARLQALLRRLIQRLIDWAKEEMQSS
jgi:N-formylglutamate deformylase